MSNDVQMWSLIVGFLLPIVTAAIIRRGWASGAQAFANFVVVVIGAAGTVYFEGNLDTSNLDGLIHSLLIVFVASIASYHGLLKPIGVAPRIEAATGGDTVAVQASRDHVVPASRAA